MYGRLKPFFFVLGVALGLAGCDAQSAGQRRDAEPIEAAPSESSVARPIGTGPTHAWTDAKPREALYGEPVRFSACYEILEERGRPRANLPQGGKARWAEMFFGCGVEASLRLSDSLLVAYGAPTAGSEGVPDLTVASYDLEGGLRWFHRVKRSVNTFEFRANFRRSFLTPQRHLVCAGTLWEASTQVACMNRTDGVVQWSGHLPMWSGITPHFAGRGFAVADLRALTIRYPYSGVEMSYRPLDGFGGRAAFYATGAESLFYSAAQTQPPTLRRYNLSGEREGEWKRGLPGSADPSFGVAFPDDKLLILRASEKVHGIDSITGSLRWSLESSRAPRSVVMHEGQLIWLWTDDEKGTLVATDPAVGTPLWRAATPTGAMRLRSESGVLLLKSVRAVRQVFLDSKG
jgi:hypothetical protein